MYTYIYIYIQIYIAPKIVRMNLRRSDSDQRTLCSCIRHRLTKITVYGTAALRSTWSTRSLASDRSRIELSRTSTTSSWSKVLRRSRHDSHQEPSAALGYEINNCRIIALICACDSISHPYDLLRMPTVSWYRPSNCQQSAAEPLRLRLHTSGIHCQLTSLRQARCPPSVDC